MVFTYFALTKCLTLLFLSILIPSLWSKYHWNTFLSKEGELPQSKWILTFQCTSKPFKVVTYYTDSKWTMLVLDDLYYACITFEKKIAISDSYLSKISSRKAEIAWHVRRYLWRAKVNNVGSDTFGNPIFQKGLQN